MIEPGTLVFVGAAGFAAVIVIQCVVNLLGVLRKADGSVPEDKLEALLGQAVHGEPVGLGPRATRVFGLITVFFLLIAAAGGIWWLWTAWH